MNNDDDLIDGLVATLRNHDAYDRIESGHKYKTLRFLATVSAPTDPEFYSPGHVVGSAFVVSVDFNRFALVRHKSLGRLLQPGGHVDVLDQTLAHTASREVQEELGLRSTSAPADELFDIDVHRIPVGVDWPSHLHFDFRYLLVANPSESNSVTAHWFAVVDIPNLSLDDGLKRMVSKCLRRGLLC
ncbi:MAG TPA: NUDIX domain-containing protein [Actinophytocola sp.]|jgi:8-oxo-dGTP pyrophosphatase MutT (NUDIX family)|uniref:NUDIX hydrolase n=1 Tax=Actinophytocola sp. TaxID=1872138 RepID=UPI002E079199|nr:NUDIX domain-containing protein [Actinophytocola sp.]